MKWIRNFGKQAESLKSNKEIRIMELDELHTFILRKKTIVGYGLLLIDMGEISSISYWVPGEQKQVKSYGKK